MAQGGENPYGSTNSSGTNWNVLQHGREAEKHIWAFYSSLWGAAQQEAKIKVALILIFRQNLIGWHRKA